MLLLLTVDCGLLECQCVVWYQLHEPQVTVELITFDYDMELIKMILKIFFFSEQQL